MPEEKTGEQARDEYLSRVAALFNHAREWTRRFDPEATFTEESVTIKEKPVAPYTANVLAISRPGYETVRLIPRGRWIIGAEGRVDMKSDLGTETLVYDPEGGPTVRIDLLTENGKVLPEENPQRSTNDVAEGWTFIQNRQLRMRPSFDADLFRRLLEVLGR